MSKFGIRFMYNPMLELDIIMVSNKIKKNLN